MKKIAPFLAVLFILFLAMPSFSDEEPRSHFALGFKGGLFYAEDETFRRFYGQRGNDIYFVEFGWYPLRDLGVEVGAGLFYERSHTIGSISQVPSGEELYLFMLPLEAGATYRLHIIKLVVPYIGGGYTMYYFNERVEGEDSFEVWKDGYVARGGFSLLLDNIDKRAAFALERDFGIQNTYFDLGARYTQIGGSGEEGLNLSGLSYLGGFVFEF